MFIVLVCVISGLSLGLLRLNVWDGLVNNIIGWLLAVLVFVGGYVVFQYSKSVGSVSKVENLPWMINAEDPYHTQVLGVHVGKNTLSEISVVFGKLPELAVFQKSTGKRTLEAYFSRVSLSVLQANIIAVLDIDDKGLSTYANFELTGKPMPSGLRKHTLSLTGLKASGALVVWKLIYMPTVNYSEGQLLKFFGEPKQKARVSTDSQYWYYPKKSLIVAYSIKGKEIFHYTSKQHYQRLMDELLEGVDEKK